MSRWALRYWDAAGLRDAVVEADSREAALTAVGCAPARVVEAARVRPALAAGLRRLRRPSRRDQLLFLVRAGAAYAAAGRVDAGRLIAGFPALARLAAGRGEALRDDLEFSARLAHLGFDATAVAILGAGERAGRLGQAFDATLDYLREHEVARRGAAGPLLMGGVLTAAGAAAFFLMPLILGPALRGMLAIEGIESATTPATTLLLAVDTLAREHAVPLVGALALAAALLWRQRDRLTALRRLDNVRRSIRLLLAWRPFHLAGVALEHHRGVLSAALGRRAAPALLRRLAEGESLADVLDPAYFSPTLTLVGDGLASASGAAFEKLSGIVLFSLVEERRVATARLALLLYAAGATLTIGVVLLAALGLIFPILGATAVGL